MWCYEVRVSDGRLAVLSSGFKTKRDAQDAGERARRMVDSICHPNLQGLTVVTEEYEPIFGSLSEMPFEPEESPNLQRLADAGPKYAWQQPVFDAGPRGLAAGPAQHEHAVPHRRVRDRRRDPCACDRRAAWSASCRRFADGRSPRFPRKRPLCHLRS